MSKQYSNLKVVFKLSHGFIRSAIVSANTLKEAIGIVYLQYSLGKFLKIIDAFPVDENGKEIDLFNNKGVLENGKKD